VSACCVSRLVAQAALVELLEEAGLPPVCAALATEDDADQQLGVVLAETVQVLAHAGMCLACLLLPVLLPHPDPQPGSWQPADAGSMSGCPWCTHHGDKGLGMGDFNRRKHPLRHALCGLLRRSAAGAARSRTCGRACRAMWRGSCPTCRASWAAGHRWEPSTARVPCPALPVVEVSGKMHACLL
jgi:hypothetical protein